MELTMELSEKNFEGVAECAAEPAQRTGKPEAPGRVNIPGHLRRLKKNEVVSHGDFVANERQELEPWDGPGGFQAGAFLKPIYRSNETRKRPAAKRKSK